MASKQKIILLSSIGTLVLLFVIGYFAVLPQIQASNYITTATAKHSAIRTEASKLKDLLKLDLFTRTDQTSDEMRVDLKKAKKDLNSVKSKLAAESEALTEFNEYPLLAWHPTYKNGLDQQQHEKDYVQNVGRAINEMDSVLTYFDASADIAAKVEAGTKAIESVALMTSMDEMIAAFETASATMKVAIEDFEKLKLAESVKEWHEASLIMNKEVISLISQLIVSMKANDVTKLNELSDKLNKLSEEGDEKSKQLAQDIVENSVLRQYIDLATETSSQGSKI